MNKKIAMIGLILMGVSGMVTQSEATVNVPGETVKPAEYFFTGKPLDKELGSYLFLARNYSPEINRWTSVDPSGFPDGSNNHIYTDNQITFAFDSSGCDTEYIDFTNGTSSTVDQKVNLNPSDTGEFSYSTNKAYTHFTGDSGKWLGPQSGAWAYTDKKTGNSWSYQTDQIGVSNSGTNTTTVDGVKWYQDWVTFTAYLNLKSVVDDVTSYTPALIESETVQLNWYE